MKRVLSKVAVFLGQTLAASILAAVCCFVISAFFWGVFHWSSRVAMSLQEGSPALQVNRAALPYMLVADASGLAILVVVVVGGPILAFRFARMLEAGQAHKSTTGAWQ